MIASSLMTILSIPYVIEFIQASGNVSLMDERRDREHGLDGGKEGTGRKKRGELVCATFAAYLVADLVVGRKYYRKVSESRVCLSGAVRVVEVEGGKRENGG